MRYSNGMVFDWHKAARLIREEQPKSASAGLSGDWSNTGDYIYQDGETPEKGFTYLASLWAPPELEMDGIVQQCWILMSDSPDWTSDTYWPESAVAILHGED